MTAAPLDAQDVRHWRDALLAAPTPSDEVALVDAIAELEKLKSAACAAQAVLTVALRETVRTREAAAGVRARSRGRGVAGQLAAARQVSPHRAGVLLGLARDLVTDLPHTLIALAEGRLSEERALVVAAETSHLERDERAEVDHTVCGDAELLDGLGTRELTDELRQRVWTLDPEVVARRVRRAEADRHVSLRTAPDAMSIVTALVPMTQGLAVHAALTRDADTLRAAGDPRSKGQAMADLLVERLTGQATAEAVPACIDLVISDETLLAAGPEPAVVPGHGPIPAPIARDLVAASLDGEVPTWLRRLYADPTGQLVATTSRQRFAPDGLADFVTLRDAGRCRTPWCDAPIRHTDHVEPVEDGGETTAANTQGLCEQCNHVKQAPGWTQQPVPGRRHTVETTTPTGHRHRSRAPALPMPLRRARPRPSPMEISFARVLLEYIAA